MTDLARSQPGDRVLEIGTGSGYQAAVTAYLVDLAYTIEKSADGKISARQIMPVRFVPLTGRR